jgi:AAA domain-containing protein
MSSSDDPAAFLAAREIYALINKDAPYPPSAEPSTAFGYYAELVQELRELHAAAQAIWARGELCDPWDDAALLWEGRRKMSGTATNYAPLDPLVRQISKIPLNGTAPLTTTYTAVPAMPRDSNDLLAMERRPVKWFAPSFLREGLGLLVGLPQVGKTPLALQLGIAIAMGSKWMGRVQCRRARVLYLGVEYTAQELIPLLDISRCGVTIPRGQLIFKTMEDEFPRETEAALEELDWYIRVLEVEVIIIDVLTAFLPPEKFKQNLYRGDYTELKPYHRLASLHQAAILGTWHGSKRETDPRIMYNGGVGLWAVPASRMSLYTDQENRVRLSSFPRMQDRLDWALTQERTNNGRRWVVADAAPEPMCSPTELQIYRWLKTNASKVKPIGISTIAEMTDIKTGTVKSSLHRMYEQNMIQHAGSGYYIEPVTAVVFETDETLATDETFATDETISEHEEVANSEKKVSSNLSAESTESPLFQKFHDSEGAAILSNGVPANYVPGPTGASLIESIRKAKKEREEQSE